MINHRGDIIRAILFILLLLGSSLYGWARASRARRRSARRLPPINYRGKARK